MVDTRKMWIGGKWVPARGNATRDVINPATGAVIAKVPEATADDVEDAVKAARAAFDGGPWGKTMHRDRGSILFKVAEGIRARAAELAEDRHEEHGQAHRRGRVRRRRRRALLRVLRGHGEQDARQDPAGARQRAVADAARAGRRRRPDHPVELPAADGRLEARAGARRGLHVGLQARRAVAAVGADARRDPREGRRAARRRQHRHRRRGRRRGARRRSARRQDRVHRRHRRRQDHRQERGRHDEAHDDGARRQEPEHRVRRRRLRGRRRRRAVRRVRQPGRGVLGRLAPAGAEVHLREDVRGARREGEAGEARRPAVARDQDGSARDRRASRSRHAATSRSARRRRSSCAAAAR